MSDNHDFCDGCGAMVRAEEMWRADYFDTTRFIGETCCAQLRRLVALNGKCDTCRGTGTAPMSGLLGYMPCTVCKGSGNGPKLFAPGDEKPFKQGEWRAL